VQCDPAETGLRLAAALWWFWELRGYWSEGREWLDRMLAAAGPIATPARLRGLSLAAGLAWKQGDWEAVARYGEETLVLAERLEDVGSQIMITIMLGAVASDQEAYDRAEALLNRGLALADPAVPEAGLLLHLAEVALRRGDPADAYRRCTDGLALCRKLDEQFFVSPFLRVQGEAALALGDQAGALAILRRAVQESQVIDHPRVIVLALLGYSRALAVVSAATRDDRRRAVQIAAAAATQGDRTGVFVAAVDRGRYDRALAAARSSMSRAQFDRAWTAGQSLTLEEAVALALADESVDLDW
jgi:tetratricopeptide (TPR) repeat protein